MGRKLRSQTLRSDNMRDQLRTKQERRTESLGTIAGKSRKSAPGVMQISIRKGFVVLQLSTLALSSRDNRAGMRSEASPLH